jgi:hypothetical protein
METLQAKYTMGDRNLKLFKNPIQFDVVRKHMRSGVGFFAPETDDELRQVFEQSLKFDGEWKRVNVWQVCLQVVGRIANRAFVGLPLCRNEELLEQSTAYARVVYQGAILITALPTALMPVFGPLVGLVAKRHASKCTSILEPYVEERLRIQSSKGACEGTGTVPVCVAVTQLLSFSKLL